MCHGAVLCILSCFGSYLGTRPAGNTPMPPLQNKSIRQILFTIQIGHLVKRNRSLEKVKPLKVPVRLKSSGITGQPEGWEPHCHAASLASR